MLVDKKHTSRDNFSYRNLFNSSIMQVSRMCLRVRLPLISLVLIVVLPGMGAFLSPMTHLIVVEAGLIAL